MSFDRRKVRIGRVVGDKMDKTVVVQVEWRRAHSLYKKSIRRNSRFKAHDSENECRIGDLVRIVETRPLSKSKHWRVDQIIAREEIAEIQPDEITVDEVAADNAAAAEPTLAEAEDQALGVEEPEPSEAVRAEQEKPSQAGRGPDEPVEEETESTMEAEGGLEGEKR
jgi:small subunit ribosomal protein S17